MEWVETTGRTVDDAKEAALDQLGVAADDAEFHVVAEPRAGLFGRLRGEARVRARVRPTLPRPKDERRRRGRRGERGGLRREAAGPDPRPGRPDSGRTDGSIGRAAEVATPDGPDPATEAVGAEAAERAPAEPPRPRRNPSRARRRRNRRQRPDASTPEAPSTKEHRVAEETDLDGQAAMAAEFLSGLVAAFELEAEVTTHVLDEDTFEVRADGDDLGLLIGPKGATLAAIQELTRTAVQRQVTNRTGRILVDVGGYQRRRKDALARFTRQLAGEVVTSGERKILEPMSPADRKVVHDTCTDIEGVRTASEGEEPRRRVVIEPAG